MATSFNADYLIDAGEGASAAATVLHHAASIAAAGMLAGVMVLVAGVGLVGAGAYVVYEPIALLRKRRRDARLGADQA